MTKLSTPYELEWSMIVFMAGISTSQPSRPNRFSDDHFLARNCSNMDDLKHTFYRHTGADTVLIEQS